MCILVKDYEIRFAENLLHTQKKNQVFWKGALVWAFSFFWNVERCTALLSENQLRVIKISQRLESCSGQEKLVNNPFKGFKMMVEPR